VKKVTYVEKKKLANVAMYYQFDFYK